jgi:hypothetical protein
VTSAGRSVPGRRKSSSRPACQRATPSLATIQTTPPRASKNSLRPASGSCPPMSVATPPATRSTFFSRASQMAPSDISRT